MYPEVEIYRNKVCVTFEELTSDRDGEPVMKAGSLKVMLSKHPELRASSGGGLGRYVRIDFYRLRDIYRERYIAKYGDPAEKIKEMRLREQLNLEIDHAARAFYEDFRYNKRGEEVRLEGGLIEKYTVNASVLNRIIAIMSDRAMYRKACNGPSIAITETIGDIYEKLRDAYGHTLPTNMARLRMTINSYKREGYSALISRKIGNRNTVVLTEDAGRYLVALKRSSSPVYTDRQIFERYNKEAAWRGWKPIKSQSTLRNYLNTPNIEPLWYDAVHGELAAHQRYGRKNKTEMPSMRDSLWYGDGTKLNLYYRAWVEGKGWEARTMQVYEVMDAYSEVLLGYHISENEDYEAQYHAYRMAIQVSGHKPYELVHDNQGGHKKIGAFLDRLVSRVHRPTAPYSGQSKTIESVFGRFQAQVLHKDWRFTGQNITAKKSSSRANLERIRANADKLYTLEELKEAYSKARKEWNEGVHHATGESRLSMYEGSINPETQEVTVPDMVDMFWLTTEKPSTYTDNGLNITIKRKNYRYEVYDEAGMPDHEFLRNNRGRRFYAKYDPYDPCSVRLYTMDADGGMRFVRIARPYFVIHRNIQEQTAGERAFITANIKANEADRIRRQIEGRVIEREHGTAMEQQGLRRPKMAGLSGAEKAEREIEREVKRRTRKYAADPEQLSPGRITKAISNMVFDPADGGIRFDERKVAGKL